MFDKIKSQILPPIIIYLVFIFLWTSFVSLFEIPPYVLPTPLEILKTFMLKKSQFLASAWITFYSATFGFLFSFLIGNGIAFFFSRSPFIKNGFYPYAIFLQTVPIVAIAPLVILWFGTGLSSVIFISFIISLFPIITNVTDGLLNTPSELQQLFRLYRASNNQSFFKLSLPYAVPQMITGAKVSSGLSIIGAIVGEFFAGYGIQNHGLGYAIIQASGQMKTDELFVSIFLSTLLGLFTFSLISLLGSFILKRWHYQ